jgi:type II secretory pathway pseudopilin PulG
LSDRAAGFSLLEAVIAFAIAALALTALVGVYASSLSAEVRVEQMLTAIEIAEDRIAALDGAGPLAPGSTGPVTERGVVWVMEIVRRPGADQAEAPVALYGVTVTVREAAGGEPLLVLATARHGPPPAEQDMR